MQNHDKFILSFSTGTIEHLGIQMYQTLPPVIAELISNAYDADAECVQVSFHEDKNTGEKKIIVADDGIGMSFNDINNKFLVVGRNRRQFQENLSPIKKRKVTGRKGIGKLAVFGIAEEIEILSVKNNLVNGLKLNLSKIHQCESLNNTNFNSYEPEPIKINYFEKNKASGTTIVLNNIKRKSSFKMVDIVESIKKRFTFDDNDFVVRFYYNNKEIASMDYNSKWDIYKGQFEWNFPKDMSTEMEYSHAKDITGKIITTEKPLEEENRGITLFARGKLVNRNEFYGIKITTSNAYNYMTGFLNVNFIDDESDLINTSRDGLLWDNETLETLKHWIQQQLKMIEKDWRTKRIADKHQKYKEKNNGKDYKNWTNKLQKHEKKLAEKIIDTIMLDENISEETTNAILTYVENSFQYTTFKEFANELEEIEIDSPELTTKLLKLFQDWEAIEAKEFYKLCIGRIETIKKLEKLINENAREVPEIHSFLKQYPWLMEPRIKDFNDEITYTKLLQRKFKESDDIAEEDRRIDFYCKSFDNNIYIYELKRPSIKAKRDELNQLTEYKEFVSKYCGNANRSFHNIYCYLVCKGISENSAGAQTLANALKNENIYVRTYAEILGQAYNYHKEFIDKYDEMNKLISSS